MDHDEVYSGATSFPGLRRRRSPMAAGASLCFELGRRDEQGEVFRIEWFMHDMAHGDFYLYSHA
jgi:hypothetical protein